MTRTRGRGSRRRWSVALVVTVLAIVLLPHAGAHAQEPGLRVADGRLVDAAGNDIVLRGVNHPHAWFPDELESLTHIRATGANSARIVLSTGARFDATDAADLERVIRECAETLLICVLQLHDTTGFGEVQDAVGMDAAAQYWVNHAPSLVGHEGRIVINIGNEPFGNLNAEAWTEATIGAVQQMRSAGLRHALMVDAPSWGQDGSYIMHDNAQDVFDRDPDRNVIFDVHMFGVFEEAAAVRSYIESFVARRLPIVIGEFGATHTDGDPDEDAIMAWAHAYGIGYIGWSWSGNTDPVRELNVVENFDPVQVTAWGRRLISGVHGVASTSRTAPVFGGVAVGPPALVASLVERASTSHRVVHDLVEAEAGILNGLGFSVQGAGFSGPGYVNGLDHVGDSLAVTVFVDASDNYDLRIGYRARFGDKTQTLVVNGRPVDDIRFPASDHFASTIYRRAELQAGYNTIQLSHDWGWIDVDYIQVESTVAHHDLRPAAE